MPGAEYDVWPLAPLPFAILGALLIARLWNVVPGRKAADPTAETLAQRARMLALLHKVQRVTLGAYARHRGRGVAADADPAAAHRARSGGARLPPAAIVQSQLHAGVRLGLALVALTAAFTPRPPRALVRAVLIGADRVDRRAGVLGGDAAAWPWAELASRSSGRCGSTGGGDACCSARAWRARESAVVPHLNA